MNYQPLPDAIAAGARVPFWFRSSDASLAQTETDVLELASALHSRQTIRFVTGLLDPENEILSRAIAGRDCLVVTTPTVDVIYGARVRAYLMARHLGEWSYRVLPLSEAGKTLDAACAVVGHALDMDLGRRSPIVAIGGGVCLDVCGFAASVYRRGVSHIKIPTTLLGLVDAGIGTKNGLNVGPKKSALGSFYPPEHTLIANDFLPSLDRRALRCGLAECLKMGIACDAELFDLIAAHGASLIDSHFTHPAPAAQAIIRRATLEMLRQLSGNLFEHDTSERLVDFGHTFSPVIESASGYAVHHGEAVAIDMAISALLARDLGLLDQSEARRMIVAIRAVGLPVHPAGLGAAEIWRSLRSVIAHRNGRLCLPLPTRIGACRFVADREALGGVTRLQAVLDELGHIA